MKFVVSIYRCFGLATLFEGLSGWVGRSPAGPSGPWSRRRDWPSSSSWRLC